MRSSSRPGATNWRTIGRVFFLPLVVASLAGLHMKRATLELGAVAYI